MCRKQIIIHKELHAFVGERPLVVIFVCESVTDLCSVWRGLNHATCLANHSAAYEAYHRTKTGLYRLALYITPSLWAKLQ